jgi:hypothetical protein
MKKILVGISGLLLLLGVGCNQVSPSSVAVQQTQPNPNTINTQPIVTTEQAVKTVCGEDVQCGEKLLAVCQPGTYTSRSLKLQNYDNGIDYAIEGLSGTACTVTLRYHDLTNPISKYTMTCSVSSDIKTDVELKGFIGKQILSGNLATCTGSLKDYLLKPATTNVVVDDSTIKTRDTARIANLKQIQTFLELYYTDKNEYPNGKNIILGSAQAACLNAAGWQPKNCANSYVSDIPSDPLKQQYYSYTLSEDRQNYIVTAKLEGATTGFSGVIMLTNSGIAEKK